MNSFGNRKELDHGFLQIDESTDYAGRVQNVTLWYYPNSSRQGLSDWQSQISFEIQSYFENSKIQEVKIWDFLSKTVDKGYGTIVLQEFFNYFSGKQTEPILVVGELSEIDERDEVNQQRRNHIYQKFGFEFSNRWVTKVIE